MTATLVHCMYSIAIIETCPLFVPYLCSSSNHGWISQHGRPFRSRVSLGLPNAHLFPTRVLCTLKGILTYKASSAAFLAEASEPVTSWSPLAFFRSRGYDRCHERSCSLALSACPLDAPALPLPPRTVSSPRTLLAAMNLSKRSAICGY